MVTIIIFVQLFNTKNINTQNGGHGAVNDVMRQCVFNHAFEIVLSDDVTFKIIKLATFFNEY